jgi:hypothetical protein
MENWLFCHPEQSEGSQLLETARFFATLRMTDYVEYAFFNSRIDPLPLAQVDKNLHFSLN